MSPRKTKEGAVTALILASLLALTGLGGHASADEVPKDWKSHVDQTNAEAGEPEAIIQNRVVSRANRFQLIGPLVGRLDRQDFHTTYVVTVAGRYHFTEESAWEFLRLDYSNSAPTDLAQEVQALTNFHPDVQLSKWQIGTAYIYTPIYGKYAWSGKSLVHFDIFGRAGAGIRFAEDRQPFAELGVGMNHYIWSNRLALVPEIRGRVYSENRSSKVWVTEGLFQLGVSWLF